MLVSAVPSAGEGGPAPLLGGPGVEVMLLAPAGEIDRRVAVEVSGVSARAGEHPIGQGQIATRAFDHSAQYICIAAQPVGNRIREIDGDQQISIGEA